MAAIQKSRGGTLHKIHPSGMKSNAPNVQDSSRVLPKRPTVNEGAVRSGVAVGDSEKGKDTGVLK